jgi:hypothetical protein
MNEIQIEQLLTIIGEQTVEIKLLRSEVFKLKKEQEQKENQNANK